MPAPTSRATVVRDTRSTVVVLMPAMSLQLPGRTAQLHVGRLEVASTHRGDGDVAVSVRTTPPGRPLSVPDAVWADDPAQYDATAVGYPLEQLPRELAAIVVAYRPDLALAVR